MKKGRESKRGRQRKGKEGKKETAINQSKLIDIENALAAVRGGGWGKGEVGREEWVNCFCFCLNKLNCSLKKSSLEIFSKRAIPLRMAKYVF